MNEKNELQICREEIDAIDTEITALFKKRLCTVDRIAEYKRKNALPVLNSGREDAVIEKVRREAGENCADDTEALYREIFRICRNRQK